MNLMSSDAGSVNDSTISAAFYDKYWTKYDFLYHEFLCRTRTIMYLVNKINLPKKSKILDIGCGLGFLSNLLTRFGEVEGIDISKRAIDTASNMFPDVTFKHGDIFESMIPESSYNLIVTTEVIEHIPRDKQEMFLGLIFDSLADNGYAIITTPNEVTAKKYDIVGNQPIENWYSSKSLLESLNKFFNNIGLYSTVFYNPRTAPRKGYFWIPLYFYLAETYLQKSDKGLYILALVKKNDSHEDFMSKRGSISSYVKSDMLMFGTLKDVRRVVSKSSVG